jgi:predicted ATPase
LKNYILTGAPGSGKTSLINEFKKKDYLTVKEAATDVISEEQLKGISEPWKYPEFIDKIVDLQKIRQESIKDNRLCFFDRSPICTYALAIYLGFKPSDSLLNELARTKEQQIYQKQVFFIKNLGFITNTQARKITFEESLKFEEIHKKIYMDFDYELIFINKAPIKRRIEKILSDIKL